MSHKSRSRVRALLAVPSAAVLMLSATQLLASPAPAARAPDCQSFCQDNPDYCSTYPTSYSCRYCGGCLIYG
ncbi:MAG TPA: hypothetical protein VF615_17645 [Longimicrobiaceae bacterium]|jgi:hypothetical protein